MPKVHGTRQQRAAELIDTLNRGPGFAITLLGQQVGDRTIGNTEAALIGEIFQREVKHWLDAWVKPEVLALIPELRTKGK